MSDATWQRVGCRACQEAYGLLTTVDLRYVRCVECGTIGQVIATGSASSAGLPIPGTWPSEAADTDAAPPPGAGEGGG